MEFLLPGERLDELNNGTLRLIQRPDAFRFGTDSVLLADFASPKRRDRVCDLGCGTGAIATLMAAHLPELGDNPGVSIDAVEIQPEIADMARRSVELNRLGDVIRVHNLDMREAAKAIGYETMTLCVCNPPYGRDGGGIKSENESTMMARHECGITLSEICRSAASLLKIGGKFAVVYPAPRAFEMMREMEHAGLAPKRIRTVHGFPGRAPKFVLIDAVKRGGEGLIWLPPLVMKNEDGSPTQEAIRIYREDKL